VAYEALVDSGADFCIFSGQLAELLGIDISSGKQVLVRMPAKLSES